MTIKVYTIYVSSLVGWYSSFDSIFTAVCSKNLIFITGHGKKTGLNRSLSLAVEPVAAEVEFVLFHSVVHGWLGLIAAGRLPDHSTDSHWSSPACQEPYKRVVNVQTGSGILLKLSKQCRKYCDP